MGSVFFVLIILLGALYTIYLFYGDDSPKKPVDTSVASTSVDYRKIAAERKTDTLNSLVEEELAANSSKEMDEGAVAYVEHNGIVIAKVKKFEMAGTKKNILSADIEIENGTSDYVEGETTILCDGFTEHNKTIVFKAKVINTVAPGEALKIPTLVLGRSPAKIVDLKCRVDIEVAEEKEVVDVNSIFDEDSTPVIQGRSEKLVDELIDSL